MMRDLRSKGFPGNDVFGNAFDGFFEEIVVSPSERWSEDSVVTGERARELHAIDAVSPLERDLVPFGLISFLGFVGMIDGMGMVWRRRLTTGWSVSGVVSRGALPTLTPMVFDNLGGEYVGVGDDADEAPSLLQPAGHVA